MNELRTLFIHCFLMEAFTHVSKQLPLLHLSIQAIQRRMWVNCHILTCIALWNTTIPLFSQILSCLLEKKTQKWAGYLQFSHLPLNFYSHSCWWEMLSLGLPKVSAQKALVCFSITALQQATHGMKPNFTPT